MHLDTVFTFVDRLAPQRLTKEDLYRSPVGEALLPFWQDLRTNEEGRLTIVEWIDFFSAIKQAMGREAFHKFVAGLVIEVGIDVSDIAPSPSPRRTSSRRNSANNTPMTALASPLMRPPSPLQMAAPSLGI